MIKVHLKAGGFVSSDARIENVEGIFHTLAKGESIHLTPDKSGKGIIIPAHSISFIEYTED